MQAISSEQKEVHMPDAPARCDIPDELIRLKQQLPHLVQALKDQRKIKIVRSARRRRRAKATSCLIHTGWNWH
jgi:hypothetical protein